MGVEIGVFVQEERLPRAELWGAAIAALRIPVAVVTDPDQTLDSQTFRFDGEDVHVSVVVIRRADEEDWEELREDLGRRRSSVLDGVDAFVVYRFSTSTEEMICASAACAGLVAVADGVLWDMEGDDVLTGPEAIALTRQVVDDGRQSLQVSQPLRTREAQRLWERGLIPRLAAAGAPPVRSHGWILTVGDVGWLAPLVLVGASGGPRPCVTLSAKVAHLYTGHALAATATHRDLAAGRRGEAVIPISRTPGPEQDDALDRIADEITSRALPHLAGLPDLASVAALLTRHLDGDERANTHEVESLAATHVLLGEDAEATDRYRQVIALFDASGTEYRTPGDWVDQQRQRSAAMIDLLASDRAEAVSRLAATAHESARELGIPPPELP